MGSRKDIHPSCGHLTGMDKAYCHFSSVILPSSCFSSYSFSYLDWPTHPILPIKSSSTSVENLILSRNSPTWWATEVSEAHRIGEFLGHCREIYRDVANMSRSKKPQLSYQVRPFHTPCSGRNHGTINKCQFPPSKLDANSVYRATVLISVLLCMFLKVFFVIEQQKTA